MNTNLKLFKIFFPLWLLFSLQPTHLKTNTVWSSNVFLFLCRRRERKRNWWRWKSLNLFVWIVRRLNAREFRLGAKNVYVPKYNGYDRQNNNVLICNTCIVHCSDIKSDIQNAINYMNNGFVLQQNDKLFWMRTRKEKKTKKNEQKLHCASAFSSSVVRMANVAAVVSVAMSTSFDRYIELQLTLSTSYFVQCAFGKDVIAVIQASSASESMGIAHSIHFHQVFRCQQ